MNEAVRAGAVRRAEYISTALDPEYATDPELEKAAARFSAEITETMVADARSIRQKWMADILRDYGGPVPSARWLRGRLKVKRQAKRGKIPIRPSGRNQRKKSGSLGGIRSYPPVTSLRRNR